MNRRFLKGLKIIVPIAIGLFLVWYSYYKTTPEDRALIAGYLYDVDLFWVGLSVLFGMLGHISRAIRWNYLLEPLGFRAKLYNTLPMVMIAYFANLGIPRSGEILRATALNTYERVPFEKGFGTIVTERVVDVIMLLFVIVLALILQTNIITGYIQDLGLNVPQILLLGIGSLVALVGFVQILRKSKNTLAQKVKGIVSGLLDGIMSIFKMKNKWAFLAHTILIWMSYFAMLWAIKYTVPETLPLDFGQLLVVFVAGALAMATTNGGIGVYPIAVAAALSLFGISDASGTAFGWIMWIAQTLMIVVFGAISFLILPLLNGNSNHTHEAHSNHDSSRNAYEHERSGSSRDI